MPEQSGWQLSQCPVGAFLVVDRDPVVSYFPDLIQVFKKVSIEHFMPIGAVKALDKSVLARFAGLAMAAQCLLPILVKKGMITLPLTPFNLGDDYH